MDRNTSNNAYISGVIAEEFRYSHEIYGEKFYTSTVDVERKSGIVDRIPIMISEKLVDVSGEWVGERVYIYGEFRSYNKYDGEHSHLILRLFARKFFCVDDTGHDDNSIELDGFIRKKPIYRDTPLKREICDILLAVNRPYGGSDYIPCICWGKNARYVDTLGVGAHLSVRGRIQSREYTKKLSDTESEIRTAYEVSISRLEVIDDANGKSQANGAE